MSFNGRQPAWHKSPGSARVCFPVSSDGPEEWRRCDERESVIYVLHHPPHQPPTEKWRVWPNWGAASDVMRVTRAWDACLDCGSSLKSQAVAFFYLALTWMNDNLWTSWGIFFYYLCLNRIFNSCSWILMWIFNNSFFLSKKKFTSNQKRLDENVKLRYRFRQLFSERLNGLLYMVWCVWQNLQMSHCQLQLLILSNFLFRASNCWEMLFDSWMMSWSDKRVWLSGEWRHVVLVHSFWPFYAAFPGQKI